MSRQNGQEDRWRAIELLLQWHGELTSSDLTKGFGISRVQASRDLQSYQENNPDQICYAANKRRYLPTDSFKPSLGSCSLAAYVSFINNASEDTTPIEWVSASQLSTGLAFNIRNNLKLIRQAIDKKKRLRVKYGSLNSPEGEWREIVPHALVCAGIRWHVRAFCFKRLAFRDFVLGRILEPVELRDKAEEVSSEKDSLWNTIVQVPLISNPALEPAQQKLVAHEYFSGEAFLPLSARACLVQYVLQAYQIHSLEDAPTTQLLVPKNPESIKPYLF